MGDPTYATFVFDTTTAALWAEEVAMGAGVPAEVVPAPSDARAKCDLALMTRAERARDLESALETEGVPFRRWR